MSNGIDDDKTPQDERRQSERRQKERDQEQLITFRVTEAAKAKLFRLVTVIATVLSLAAAMAGLLGYRGYNSFLTGVREGVIRDVAASVDEAVMAQIELSRGSFEIVDNVARDMLKNIVETNVQMTAQVKDNERTIFVLNNLVDSLNKLVEDEVTKFELAIDSSRIKLQKTIAKMDDVDSRVEDARAGADKAEALVDALADSSRSKLDSIGKEYTDLADQADKVLVRANNAADSMHAVFSEANQELSTFRKTAEKANYDDFVKDLKGMKKEADEQRKKLDKTRKNSDKTYGNLEDMKEQLEDLERKLKKLKSEVKDNCDYFDQLLRSRDSTATASLSHGN